MAIMLFLLILLAFQVIARYFFTVSWAWIDEIARYGLIWLAYLSAVWATYKGVQIKVDLLTNLWPAKIRKVIKWIGLIIFFVYCVTVAYFSMQWLIDLIHTGTTSVAMHAPMPIFQCIVPVAHILMAIRLLQVAYRYIKHPEILEPKSKDEEFEEYMSVAKGGNEE